MALPHGTLALVLVEAEHHEARFGVDPRRYGGIGPPGCPAAYGPRTTIYNRFNRWSRRGFWRAMLTALAKSGWAAEAAAIDSTYVKAHRSAHGGKGVLVRKASARPAGARRPRSTSSPMSSAAPVSSC